MAKLADGLYLGRGADLLAGQLDPGGWAGASVGRLWKQPNISSLSRGRGKLGADPVRMLFEQVAWPTGADGAPGVFCCGLRVVSMDGSTTGVPDSKENDAFFGRPSNHSRDGALPQVRWVAAAESGTGSLLGAAMGPYRAAEQSLARDLLHRFGPGMVVLADRMFLSWSLARAFLATGAHILWRASASFTLKPVSARPDGTYLAELKPPRKSDGPVLAVRVIEYTVPHRRRRPAPSRLRRCSLWSRTFSMWRSTRRWNWRAAASEERWGCQTVIGHHKTDMGAATFPSRKPGEPRRHLRRPENRPATPSRQGERTKANQSQFVRCVSVIASARVE